MAPWQPCWIAGPTRLGDGPTLERGTYLGGVVGGTVAVLVGAVVRSVEAGRVFGTEEEAKAFKEAKEGT